MKKKHPIVDYLDVRIGLRDIIRRNLTRYQVPGNINFWYTLGSVLLFLFLLQFITGTLLLVYYVPHTEQAFASVQRIMNDVPFGWFIRYMHAVGANIIILILLLHVFSVLFMSSYKNPRELTWAAGFLLLLLSLGMCLTGYLLPWSQLSYWATTVATESAGALPVLGEKFILFLRGGPSVGQHTLGRFFALHVMGLPLIFLLLVLLHLFLVRRIGISRPPFGPDYQSQPPPKNFRHEEYPHPIPFYPDYLTKDLAAIFAVLALFMAVVFYCPWIFLPAAAFEPADPFSTPVGIKPEWYFLASYQTLKILPSETAGILVQMLAVLTLFLLPFFDSGRERRPGRRPLFIIFLGILLIGYTYLTIWGHFS